MLIIKSSKYVLYVILREYNIITNNVIINDIRI